MIRSLIFILLLSIWVITSVGAEELEMVTDRPDQTESTNIVPPGYAQIETGWKFTQEDEAGERIRTNELPTTLMRIGLTPKTEFRLGWGGYAWQTTRQDGVDTDSDGAQDLEIGGKIHLWNEENLRPDTALLFGVSKPTGSAAFSSHEADPSFRFSMAHTLNEKLSLGYNLGAAWATEENAQFERHTLPSAVYTLALGVDLSERWGAFIETFGEIPTHEGRPKHSIDGGFTYLIKENIQLDLAAGFGLSSAADDIFIGTGISIRFPK